MDFIETQAVEMSLSIDAMVDEKLRTVIREALHRPPVATSFQGLPNWASSPRFALRGQGGDRSRLDNQHECRGMRLHILASGR